MYTFRLLLVLCLVYFSVQQLDVWSGNVCSETTVKTNYTNVCNCTIFVFCCGYINITEEYNETEYFCCPGWTHSGDQNCSTPICTSPCLNGGTCINPDTCSCPSGYEGETCGTVSLCSHLLPCYPGECSGVPKQCVCANSFTGSSCLTFDSSYTPTLHRSNSTLTYVDPGTNIELYDYRVNSMTADNVTWSNQKEYSLIEFSIEATFNTSDVLGPTPEQPSYIHDVVFGIVKGTVEYSYSQAGSGAPLAISYSCNGVSKHSPVDLLQCYVSVPFGITVSSGDIFNLQFIADSGGFRQLKNIDDNSITAKEFYTGRSEKETLEFRFDFDVPQHCIQDTSPCSDSPMELTEDITRNAIKPFWTGWTDALSGVYRYSFEIWKMEYVMSEDALREPLITSSSNPEPLFITEIMASSLTFPEYTPSGPGVYSVILEINDKANNSEYVRRVAIFDATSEITLNSTKRLFVSTASINTNYLWQTSYNLDGITTINVVWEDFFANNLHNDEHFLSKVMSYEPRLSDNIERTNYKRILSEFDDNEGDRMLSSISHIKGIVKFEMVHEIISKPKTEPPEFGWIPISPLAQTTSFQMAARTIGDGDSHQVWIRASDVTKRNKTATTVIHFDQTGPDIYLTNIEYNIGGGQHQFTSRLTVVSQDLHSGVLNVTFDVVLNQTGEIKYQTQATIENQTKADCTTNVDCYCVSMGQCFTKTMMFNVDNCILGVPLELVENGTYSLHVTSRNTAIVSTLTIFEMGTVANFKGIDKYPSPSAITVVNKTNTAVTIQWTNVPTCYVLQGYIIYLHKPDNATLMFSLEKNATEHTISDLSPGAVYRLEIYTEYGSDSYIARSPVPLNVTFTTDEQPEQPESDDVNILAIILPIVITLLIIIIASAVIIRFYLKKRLRRLSTSPSLQPDVVLNGNAKQPILQGTHITEESTSGKLPIPDRPNIDASFTNEDENVVFRLDLPKGRAKTLPPISSRLGEQN